MMSINRRKAIVAMAAVVAAGPVLSAARAAGRYSMTVHKESHCKCCNVWIAHLEQAGFDVEAIDEENIALVKDRLGVPADKRSCHTAEVEGYFVEGHVPAEDIERLLEKRPAAKGLTVPDMPLGSPGMEVPSGRVDPYEVLLVREDGSTSVFARYGTKPDQAAR